MGRPAREKLTESKEDYLRAFYFLEEKREPIQVTRLASYLGVSKPSIHEMVRKLAAENLIRFKLYSTANLTEKGRSIARKLTARHRIIECFLEGLLGITHDRIHQEAHRLEHAFSDESILKIFQLMNRPEFDPHGRIIPSLSPGGGI